MTFTHSLTPSLFDNMKLVKQVPYIDATRKQFLQLLEKKDKSKILSEPLFDQWRKDVVPDSLILNSNLGEASEDEPRLKNMYIHESTRYAADRWLMWSCGYQDPVDITQPLGLIHATELLSFTLAAALSQPNGGDEILSSNQQGNILGRFQTKEKTNLTIVVRWSPERHKWCFNAWHEHVRFPGMMVVSKFSSC